MEGLEGLQEFIVINPTDLGLEVKSTPSKEYKYWSNDNTRILIDCYAKYKKRVGTLEIRSMKNLWEIIANEMKLITNENITSTNCENRWKVLERNYKAFIDNNKKSGRGRKVFEFAQEMDNIFGKKKNVNPEILLESDTIDKNIDVNNQIEEIVPLATSQENIEKGKNETPKVISRKSALKRKNCILEKIGEEKKEYYSKKLIIESERLQVEKEKLQEMRKRNAILEERNNILKKYIHTGILSEAFQ